MRWWTTHTIRLATEAVGSFVKNWPGSALGVIGAPGDRRDQDILELGQISADIFDQVVIKEDSDRRGRDMRARWLI